MSSREQFFENVSIDVKEGHLVFEGPLGSVTKHFGGSDILFDNDIIYLFSKSGYSNFISCVRQVSEGLVRGFYVELELTGLGFRFLRIEDYLLLKLGYSHYIRLDIPEGVHAFGFKKKLVLFGLTLESVMGLAALLRRLKKPDPYKGKGVRLFGETLKLKVGKQK